MDPRCIDVTGGSAGGHLSLMVAMVPEDFADGGPAPGLEGVSARVSGSFSFIPPTHFVRFWNQGADDVVTNQDGKFPFAGRMATFLMIHVHVYAFFSMASFRTPMDTKLFIPGCRR